MSNPFSEIQNAYQDLMKHRAYRRALPLIALAVFAAFVLMPALLIPYNTIAFQLQILKLKDYLIFALLSMATALLILMQVFLFRRSRSAKARAVAVGGGSVGAYSAIMGGFLATAACSSCIAGLLGFLGAGSVFFVAKNSGWFALGALAIMAVALYSTAKQFNGYCGSCEVGRKA